MSGVVSWLIGILAIVILGTVVDLILGESKMGKYIKSAFAAVTVLVILLPIPGIFKNGNNLDEVFRFENEFNLDENYLAYTNRVKLTYLEKGVEEQLHADGIENAKVKIEGLFSASEIKIELVRVNLKNAVIDTNKQHINKYELTRQLVSEYLSIEKGLIIIDD